MADLTSLSPLSAPTPTLSTHVATKNYVDHFPVTQNLQTGTAYTLQLSDVGVVVEVNNASPITVTVPANASVAFPLGAVIEVSQYGVGQIAVTAAVGVTLRPQSPVLTRTRYSSVLLRKRATNEWVITGDAQ